MAAASTPACAAARSGGQSAATAATASNPVLWAGAVASSSAKRTCSIPSSRKASPPGRTATCREASRAVSVRRGSTTTTVPPRAITSRRRCRAPGALISDPLETDGLAPRTSMKSVRSRSGIGNIARFPNISADVRCWGSWSVDVAEEWLRPPIASRSGTTDSTDHECAVGLPT